MDPERWRRIDAVFQSALGLDSADRAAYLDRVCEGDADLRRDIELLLSADGGSGDLLDAPAVEAAAPFLADADPDLAFGTFVAGYRIHSRIGSGGMGDVYRADDPARGRTVAIKLLPPALTDDPRLRGRFLREARLASSLDHPNVCAVYKVGRSGDRLYIAMEYVDGATVKRLVAPGPLSVRAALSVAIQAADGVAAAHRRAIVHRDVKSGNIVVTDRGRAVVLDFGLAKLLESGSASLLTRPGAVLGTPAYMSPEQARGDTAGYRSDVWSLGVVMYEMLAARLPFERRSEAETLRAVVREPHAPLGAHLPIALRALVDRALAKDPAHRFPSVEAMRDELRRVERDVEAGPADDDDDVRKTR